MTPEWEDHLAQPVDGQRIGDSPSLWDYPASICQQEGEREGNEQEQGKHISLISNNTRTLFMIYYHGNKNM